jgi:GT2 family glycosyltransferase
MASATSHRSSLCVFSTCHNRCAKTLECLRALEASVGLEAISLSVILVDDGSTDGTAQAVTAEFPRVRVIAADGSLFWCRGMHRAFAEALREGHDYYLWLNDDTLLQPDAIARLVACEHERRTACGRPVIVTGSTVDGRTGEPTYGGEARFSRWRRTAWRLVPPAETPRRVETMDGNLVLISAAAADRVGNLDPAFEHAMADFDYGLRANAAGVEIWLAPQVHATCSANPVQGTFQDASLNLRARWRHFLSRKALPWRSWLRFTRRHAGLFWPLFFTWPYVRVVLGRPARTKHG